MFSFISLIITGLSKPNDTGRLCVSFPRFSMPDTIRYHQALPLSGRKRFSKAPNKDEKTYKNPRNYIENTNYIAPTYTV